MVTLDQVKTFLGISSNEDDLRLQLILDSVLEQSKNICGDLEFGIKKQIVKNSSVKNETFTLNIINATKLLKVNGIDYSGKVSGIDYFINTTNEIIVKGIYGDISNDFGFFEVEYEAGFTTPPSSFIGVIATYCGVLYAKDLGKDVISENLGPRGVNYLNTSISDAEKNFNKGLRAFIPISLLIY